jgi:signal transduction histidine kinase
LIIVLITIAILIFPLSKRLTRPLRELHQRGQDWAEGRLEKRANIQVKDEIGDLAGTFNTMAENLQKMLQQRKEFLASISHELKSPLARMRIALELLNEKNSGQPETSKLLGGIEREIAESEQLIEQLLVLSKVEMNMPLSKESIALGILTKKAIEQIQPLAYRASVTFRIEGDATVHADYVQLERVMINVLENAIKFSPPGESIAIHIQRHNQYATWKCIDHGPGVDSSETEKIFQPFYRGKVTANKEGSGLGLFIARRIVEMHGGSIHAMKNDGTGMAIEIQLPV